MKEVSSHDGTSSTYLLQKYESIYLQIFTSFCTSRDIVRYKVRWQLNLGDQTIHNFFRDQKFKTFRSDRTEFLRA